MTKKRFKSEDYSVGYYTEIVDNEKELEDVPNPKKNLTIEEAVDILNELHEENEQLKQAKKFFEEVLFNVIYATSDYQRLVLNQELLEVIDECKSLEELREKANYGVEEFREEHKWLE